MNEQEKIQDFVDHLFANPMVSSEPLPISEGLILSFLLKNKEQLSATFKTPRFFPSMSWDEVVGLIAQELARRVTLSLQEAFNDFVDNAELDLLNSESGASLPLDFHKEKFHEFLPEMLSSRDARFFSNAVLNIFENDVVEKYLREIFNRRDFLYNELVRVQRTNLEYEEYIVFMKSMLLARNAVYMKIPLEEGKESSATSLNEINKSPRNMKRYAADIISPLRRKLPMLSEKALSLAIKSNFRNDLTDLDEGSARLMYIFSSRFQNYRPLEKVDRGAESPDKSWFAVARKNADHYGYDKRMLEDLYMIAGDNNW